MLFGLFGKKDSVDSTVGKSLPKSLRPSYSALLQDYLSLRGKDIDTLQAKAYEMLWDSIHASSYASQMTSLTVNTGLTLEAAPDSTVLNIDPKASQEWANKTESYFRVWQNSKESDYSGRDNFRQLQISAFLSQMVFGEFFAILRYSVNSARLNPISIQLIPPTMVCAPTYEQLQTAKQKNNKVIDGIEINPRGEEVAVYLGATNANDELEVKRYPYKGEKTGKTLVLHGYKTEPGQYRGVPPLAKVFSELKKIADAQVFELASMAANATLLGAIEREQEVVNNEKLQGLGTVSFSKAPCDATATASSQIDANDIDITKGGLFLQNLEPGEKLKILDSTRPNLNIPEFINQIFDWVGPSVGLPSSVWKMQFNASYSASKAELELAWRNMDVSALQFSSDFNQPVYEAWLLGEVANGNISAAGYASPYGRKAWASANWNRIPIPALNPLQEAKASNELILGGLSTRDREAQRRTGSSFKNNAERLTVENEELSNANASMAETEDAGVEGEIENEEGNK